MSVRALTVRQPHASLIAVGAKPIETRSWATSYRGPLVIHAGLRVDQESACSPPVAAALQAAWVPMPLGAVVASCQLVDVVPILDGGTTAHDPEHPRPCLQVFGGMLTYFSADVGSDDDVRTMDDQLPFGDFTPGRFAWLLEDVKPTTERCPACWGTGYDGYRRACVRGEWIDDAPHPCPLCHGTDGEPFTFCDPIPAKGRQGLWTWAPEAVGA